MRSCVTKWGSEQVSGQRRGSGEFAISHETICRHVWRDRQAGGSLHEHLRGARKRYGAYDSRGRLAGKRMIGERPASIESRQWLGHWEIDTVLGSTSECVVTLVERATGFTLIGKMAARTVAELNRATLELMRRHPGRFHSITADNGTEFHGYKDLETFGRGLVYFATPHHSWERGTNENTNGLICQYLPKGTNMEDLRQKQCDAIPKSSTTDQGKDMTTKPQNSASREASYGCISKLVSHL